MISRLFDFIGGAAHVAAAILFALLPYRHWDRFTRVPIARAVAASAIVTMVGGFLMGTGGFLAYAGRASDILAEATLEIGARQAAGVPAGTAEVTTAAPVSISLLSLPAFILFTPLGWLSTYLVLSGLVRAVSNYVDDPVGDPLLTGLDMLATGLGKKGRDSSSRWARERLEGPEVPDALYTGAWAGLPDVDFVVVASRRRPEWTAGTFVITSDRWYTLGDPFDVRVAGGLRTAYPLTAQKVTEVLRRGVHYELPLLRRGPAPGR